MLQSAGVPVSSCAAPIDEAAILAPDPITMALDRATAKATSVAASCPQDWVIGADQVAWMGDEIFHKPADPSEHRAMLRALRGRAHTLSTAVVVVAPDFTERLIDHTQIWFRDDLSDEEIDAYVASGEGSACAGGYQAEARGAQLIAKIEGDWFNVLGLPLLPLIGVLRRHGWRPVFASAAGES